MGKKKTENPAPDADGEAKSKPETKRGEMFDARFEMNGLFAKKARNARTGRKISLDALNIGIREKTGIEIGLQRLSRFERGLSLPNPAELWAMATFYGVNMTWMANPNDDRGVEDRTPDESADLRVVTRLVEQLGTDEAMRRLLLAPPAASPASPPASPEMPRALDPESVIKPTPPPESPPKRSRKKG